MTPSPTGGCSSRAHLETEKLEGPTDKRPLACPHCGRPRCIAAVKSRPGERCRRHPHPGARVCTHHGLSPAARENAATARAEAEADKLLGDLWPGLAGAVPLADPIDLLQRTATVLGDMADTVGERVNRLTAIAGGEGGTQLRAEVVLLDRLLDKLLKAAEGLARLNLAERQVELAAGQAQLVTGAARAMLATLDQLLPADRDRAMRAFLGALGRGPEVPQALPSPEATSPITEEQLS